MGHGRRRFGIGRKLGLLALACLILLGTAVPVLADPPGPSAATGAEGAPGTESGSTRPEVSPFGATPEGTIGSPPHGPSGAAVEELLRSGREREEAKEAFLESPQAAAERHASMHAYEGLDAGEAEELLLAKFPEMLAALNDDPARRLSSQHLVEPLGEGDALVSSEGHRQLLDGSVPVEAMNEEGELAKVDVELEPTGEGFRPQNPVVELSIPESVEDGIEVGEAAKPESQPPITVTQVGAEKSTGVEVGDKNVFFHEVEPGSDTDLLVSPTEGGVELFDQLRSPESPETLRFEIEVPQGDELRTIADGAEVVAADGSPVYLVEAPTATDAQGAKVPVSLSVEGDTVVLQVSHHGAEYAYPILVDPYLENLWNWNGAMMGIPPWQPYQSAAGNGLDYGVEDNYFPQWHGLFFAAQPGYLAPNAWTELALQAPSWGSYISWASISTWWRSDGCSPLVQDPYDYDGMYVWQEDGHAVTEHWTGENVNDAYWYGNSSLPWWGNEVLIGYGNAVGEDNACWRNVMDGDMSVDLEEWVRPKMTSLSGVPSGWINGSTSFNVQVAAEDYGLGLKQFTIVPGGYATEIPITFPCNGSYREPCPIGYVSREATLYGYGFASGEHRIKVSAEDALREGSGTLEAPIKVDTKPPELEPHGQLVREIANPGPGEGQNGEGGPELDQPVYNLKVRAVDGSNEKESTKQSGVKTIEVFVDGTNVKTLSNASCPASSCSLEGTVPIVLSKLNPAIKVHHVKIEATDFVGNQPEKWEREFEYIPLTGLTEEDVTQRFLLPDGKNHGEGSYQGPELAVNVMNGNVVYHQRDVDVEGPDTNLEVELFYNALLPKEESSEFGTGWTLAQTPTLTPSSSGKQATALTSQAELTGGVMLPQQVGEEKFSDKLNAVITKEPGGAYAVSEEGGPEAPATVYDATGQATETQTSPTASVEYGHTGEHLSEIAVDDPGSTTAAPPPVKKAPSIVPNYVSSFGSVEGLSGVLGLSELSGPTGVAIDSKGNLWVADNLNDRIEKFSPTGEPILELGSSGSSPGELREPTSLAFDRAGDLWVTDTRNNRVEEFSATGDFMKEVGTEGSGTGQFRKPQGIAVAPNGHILVTDTGNDRIVELSATGVWTKVFGPSGAAELEPTGIGVSSEGNVWVADRSHNRVFELSEAGTVIRVVGSAGSEEGQFNHPMAIAVGASGEVWVGDSGNDRVEELNKEGGYAAKFGSPGSGPGQLSLGNAVGIATDNQGGVYVVDQGDNRVEHWKIPAPASQAVYVSQLKYNEREGLFKHPAGLAVDHRNNVWVPDLEDNRIEEFNQKEELVRQVGGSGSGPGKFNGPKSIAFDDEGDFWVADSGNDRLEEFNENAEFLKAIESPGTGYGTFNRPEAVAVAPNGHIWVADTYNYRIVELDEEGNFIRVVNPSGLGHIEPTGIAFGLGGNAWVADWADNRVVEISPTGELVRQIGAAGSGNGQFSHPDTVAVDPRGLLYVVDQSNDRVEVFGPAGEYLSQFGWAGSGAGQFRFGYPTGIAADNRGNLWVADSENNRVEKWQTGSWVPAEEEVVPTHDDPSVAVTTSAGLVTSVVGVQAGSHHYGHSTGQLLTSDEGPEGTTHYEYEGERLKKITLPNNTTAEIQYDPTTGRATKVTVHPAGGEARSTEFRYVQEGEGETPETIVEPEHERRTFYLIGPDGVLRSRNTEQPPTFRSESGSFVERREQELRPGNQNLYIEGHAPEGIRKIQFIANGTTIVDEKTCTGTDAACENEHLQWITDTEELAPGTMWIEAVLTDTLGNSVSKRWWVTVPYTPPPPNGVPTPPRYPDVLRFREEYGLDLDLNPISDELELHERVLETIGWWHNPQTPLGEVARASWERWGVPLRPSDVAELEYREAFAEQDLPLIQTWAKEHAWSSYGGDYMDERAGGLLRVGFTERQAELLAQMKQELGGQLAATDRIVGFTTPPAYTVGSVEATSGSINAYWASHPSMGENITGAAFNSATNKVRVEATNVAQAESEIASITGSLSRVEFVYEPEKVEPLDGRWVRNGVIEAGEIVGRPGRGACTAGFGAAEPQGFHFPEKIFLLTAGHCFRPGEVAKRAWEEEEYAEDWNPIGKVTRNALPEVPQAGETDGLAIDMGSGGANAPLDIYRSREIKPVADPSEWEPGKKLCFSGLASGHQSGVSQGESGFEEHERFSNGIVINTGRMVGIRVTQMTSHHGDSGSPVYNCHTGRSVGLLSAGKFGRREVWVTPLAPLPAYGGVSQPGILKALEEPGSGHHLYLYPYG